MRQRIRNFRCRGITIAESMLALTVLMIASVGISRAVLVGQVHAYTALDEQRAMELADELMQRISALDYLDPDGSAGSGPDVGETNALLFDNIDDYDGYVEEVGSVTDILGNALPEVYRQFGRSVSVVSDTRTIPALSHTQPGLTVTVTVTSSKGRTWTLTRFFAEESP